MSLYPEAKTFTDFNGKRGKIGDLVRIVNKYTLKETDVILEVKRAHRQGADGTILHFDNPPDPDYPSNKSHRANETIIVRA